jgi:hypothetical protein
MVATKLNVKAAARKGAGAPNTSIALVLEATVEHSLPQLPHYERKASTRLPPF